MKEIYAVFMKQIKDTFGNKMVLIQFIMFPLLTLIMEKAISIPDMPEHYFVKMFSLMFIGMAPLTAISAIISEEKEKNTLRALTMSGVTAPRYLAGTGAYVFIMCMAGTCVFAAAGEYSGTALLKFMLIMATGITVSILIGAAIGISSSNQMSATSLTVPSAMVLSFIPMLSNFNEKIKNVAEFFYPQQLNVLINGGSADTKCVTVITLEAMMILALFVIAYRKKGLE